MHKKIQSPPGIRPYRADSIMESTVKRGICGICSAGCWIVASYDKDGNIVRVRPDESSEMGMLCTLGEHSPDIIYSEHRVLTPLKRTGKKGSYAFAPISWNEAYRIITTRLQAIKAAHGPEAAAVYTGVGTFEPAYCDIFQPKGVAVSSASSILFPFGSPNTMGVGALCYVAYGMIAPHVTCGKMLIDMFNDLENSELIVVWGTNPATDLPPVDMKRILNAKNRGAEVIVIDPRRTETAHLTDAEWIPVRPGTDGALALGMISVLIEEELYDEQFVSNWSTGFADFARYAQHFSPQAVEHITGIQAETIRSAARRIAGAHGASQLMYTGLEYSNCGVQSIRAALSLWALAGQLDVPGGRCFHMPGSFFPINRGGHVAPPQGAARIGEDRFPVYSAYRNEAHAMGLPESVLEGIPYKIRALIIQGSSITTSWPNAHLWQKTLSELDFLVCIDRQLSADAAYADIVLPACTYYETESYMVYGNMFRIRERMISPRGKSRSDIFIMSTLAKHLGYGHLYPQTETELLSHVLEGSGFTCDDVRKNGGTASIDTPIMQFRKWEKGLLRADGKPGFDTPSGKFEFASHILEEHGYAPLPEYTEPQEGPLSRGDMLSDYPLVFNSGSRTRTSFHTQHHGISNLNREHPEPVVTINTSDAENRAIRNGEKVRILSPRGEVAMRAHLSDDIAPGFVDANHACGSPVGPRAWRDTNINIITDIHQYDPISGFPVYKCLLCDIKRDNTDGNRVTINTQRITPERLGVKHDKREISTEVYLDHNATTPLSKESLQAMTAVHDRMYGNPSSIHTAGVMSRKIIDDARRLVANALNCTARRIIFTSGGSEAINLAIKGTAFSASENNTHIITSVIEHPSVLNACDWLEDRGFTITRLPVDSTGKIDPYDLRHALTPQTCLVTLMMANNETGTVQPIKKLAAIARSSAAYFHTDAVQAFGKIPVDVQELNVDLLSVSAHKLYGPKGAGALYIAKTVNIESLIHGGGQEYGIRSGTENVPCIAGFGKAAEALPQILADMSGIRSLRDMLEQKIGHAVPSLRLNGHRHDRLPNTLNVVLPGYRGESVVLAMAQAGIYFSSGSACKAGSSDPSHALLAMGLSETDAHCSVRFTLGRSNTEDDIMRTSRTLDETLKREKQRVNFVPCR